LNNSDFAPSLPSWHHKDHSTKDATGAGSNEPDTELAGERVISTRLKSRGLFIAHLNKTDSILSITEGFHDTVEDVAGHTDDYSYALVQKTFNHDMGGGLDLSYSSAVHQLILSLPYL
jgi:hypothetical protein